MLLSRRLRIHDIKEIVKRVSESPAAREEIWNLARSREERSSVNALWAMTHLSNEEKEWLLTLQSDMINMLLTVTTTAKKRLLLQLLREQDFEPDNIRVDFLEFCLSKINSECEPYAIRCFSIYIAFNLCRHYPELISELERYLDLLCYQQLSPGLECALKKTRKRIAALKITAPQT